jgi:hypothetical protein
VMHEVFHREQEALGLRQPDALNNQLDMRPGRTWLRLEYRALASALDALPNQKVARHHAESAMIFRARRRSLYPGSDSLEATLEIQEGLPEYTGQRLAMQLSGEGTTRVAKYVRDYESTPTFVRAFAYGTGPAIGVLLDSFAPTWRNAVLTNRDIGALLAEAIHFQRPRALAATALIRAREYGWDEVDRSEAARDSARAPAMREYRARLADGATLTLRQSKDSLSWSYDPTELIGFDLTSTIYPSGNFSAPWGKLSVERGGVLVRNDFSAITVAAPVSQLTRSGEIRGEGWSLELASGWSIRTAGNKYEVIRSTDPVPATGRDTTVQECHLCLVNRPTQNRRTHEEPVPYGTCPRPRHSGGSAKPRPLRRDERRCAPQNGRERVSAGRDVRQVVERDREL